MAGWSRGVKKRQCVAYAVQTAGNAGSALLIFVANSSQP
jgi:hypothetical protein